MTFTSGDHQFEITVRLSDGVMQSEVSEEGNDQPSQHTSVPPTTDGDNHGGGGDNND